MKVDLACSSVFGASALTLLATAVFLMPAELAWFRTAALVIAAVFLLIGFWFFLIWLDDRGVAQQEMEDWDAINPDHIDTQQHP